MLYMLMLWNLSSHIKMDVLLSLMVKVKIREMSKARFTSGKPIDSFWHNRQSVRLESFVAWCIEWCDAFPFLIRNVSLEFFFDYGSSWMT